MKRQCICYVPGHIGERCPIHAFTNGQLDEIAEEWRKASALIGQELREKWKQKDSHG